MDLTSLALALLSRYGPLALCLFVFLETSMLFPFLPSEVVVPAAAALLVTDPASLVVFVTAATVGGTAGAFLPYAVFHGGALDRSGWLGRHLAVSDAQVERGQAWFNRWGQSSVLWGRFLPVLRSVISVPAGLADMDPVRFGTLTALGTVGFYAATGWLVYYGRRRSVGAAVVAFAADHPLVTVVVALAALGAALLLGRRFDRRRRRG